MQINKAFRIPMHHLVAAFDDAAATVISRGVLDGKRSCVPQALMMAAGFSPAQRANTESRTMLAWPILPVLLRQCALVLVQPPDGCNLAGPSTPQPPSTVEPREGARFLCRSIHTTATHVPIRGRVALAFGEAASPTRPHYGTENQTNGWIVQAMIRGLNHGGIGIPQGQTRGGQTGDASGARRLCCP